LRARVAPTILDGKVRRCDDLREICLGELSDVLWAPLKNTLGPARARRAIPAGEAIAEIFRFYRFASDQLETALIGQKEATVFYHRAAGRRMRSDHGWLTAPAWS